MKNSICGRNKFEAESSLLRDQLHRLSDVIVGVNKNMSLLESNLLEFPLKIDQQKAIIDKQIIDVKRNIYVSIDNNKMTIDENFDEIKTLKHMMDGIKDVFK